MRNYSSSVKFSCQSGFQWAALEGILMSYHLIKIALLKRAAKGCNVRTFDKLTPLTKIAMQEWVAKSCNERSFEDLPP